MIRKEPIAKACATEAITTLRMYFECCENTDETIFKSLNTVKIAVSTSKQVIAYIIILYIASTYQLHFLCQLSVCGLDMHYTVQ